MWNGKINYFRGFKNYWEIEEKFEKAKEIYKDNPIKLKDIKDEYLSLIMMEGNGARNARLMAKYNKETNNMERNKKETKNI